MSRSPMRDLIGYGGDLPHPHWPGEARITVNFVMNYEERSEYARAGAHGVRLRARARAQSQGRRGHDYFTFVKDGSDVLYREGTTQPKMMSLGLHPRLIGHPSRAAGLERALDYIRSHEGV